MKPKQRITQAQSSRMVLRNHDHRDIIYDSGMGPAYHYAMYVYKTPKYDQNNNVTEEGINGYVWFKTPHNYILLHGTVSAGSGIKYGWMDIDREWQTLLTEPAGSGSSQVWVPFKNKSGMKDHMNTASGVVNTKDVERFIHVGNHIIHALGEGRDNIVPPVYDYTDNGVIWKVARPKTPVGSNVVQYAGRRRPFGNNGWVVGDYFIGATCYETGYQHLKALVFYEVDTFTAYNISINLTDISNSRYYYCCPTQTGCIIKIVTQSTVLIEGRYEYIYDFLYYHVTVDGNYYCVSTVDNAYGQVHFSSDWASWGNLGILSYVRHGNVSGYLHFVYNLYYDPDSGQDYYGWFFTAHLTHNNGVSWKAHTLLHGAVLGGYPGQYPDAKGHMFFAQGRFYAIISTSDHTEEYSAYEVRMYSTLTGDAWEEVKLPKWLDVPIISENTGIGIDDVYSEKLRIAVNPEATSGADCNMHEMYGSDIIRFKDGQIDMTNELFGVYLTDGLHNAYFDNKYLAENAKSFAWISGGTTVVNDYAYADYVQKYDFCVPAGGFEGEEPDPDMDFVWYVWNPETEKFEVVDRHLSTYASYTMIVVEELPETGELQTLYGVKTDLESSPIYQYYVWDASDYDFKSVDNLSLYANYTLVIVQNLPTTGATNVIYGVPVDYTAYATNMYIWNPDITSWIQEKINGVPVYDEHGNPVYIEVQGGYEDINTTTYDMTGKRYRTVNVKTLPDIGYVGIIYISEKRYTPQIVTHDDNTYNYYMFDILNGEYYIVSPTRNTAVYNIILVMELPPFDPTADYEHNVYKIPKEVDESGHDTHDYYQSEQELKDYLTEHLDKHTCYIYTKENLPLVGTNGVYYVVKDVPGQYSGKYSVYLWNWMLSEWDLRSEYNYFISEDPEDPKPIRFIDVIHDYFSS